MPTAYYVSITRSNGEGTDRAGNDQTMSTVTDADGESLELPSGFAFPKQDMGDTDPLSLDVMFELLKNKRRRDLLRYLEEQDDVVTMSDLAEHVAAIENDIPEAQLSSQQRKRVYVALYQCHLPILDRADVVNFNKARGLIERTPRADQLRPYLEQSPYRSDPWPRVYLTLGIVSVVGFSTVSVGGGASWMLTSTVMFFVFVLLALSLVHWHWGRELPPFPSVIGEIGSTTKQA